MINKCTNIHILTHKEHDLKMAFEVTGKIRLLTGSFKAITPIHTVPEPYGTTFGGLEWFVDAPNLQGEETVSFAITDPTTMTMTMAKDHAISTRHMGVRSQELTGDFSFSMTVPVLPNTVGGHIGFVPMTAPLPPSGDSTNYLISSNFNTRGAMIEVASYGSGSGPFARIGYPDYDYNLTPLTTPVTMSISRTSGVISASLPTLSTTGLNYSGSLYIMIVILSPQGSSQRELTYTFTNGTSTI